MKLLFMPLVAFFFCACVNDGLDEKGFPVNTSQSSENNEDENVEGIHRDSVMFETRPSNVLLTGIPNVRLTTVYKVNVYRRDGTTFIGSNNFLYKDTESEQGNNWNGNLIPGLEGVYGYNLVNISHYDLITKKTKGLFEKPVLVKTLYYPSFSKDTLNSIPVKRAYFFVSVYNDDTNKDGFINQTDLRRFFYFNSNGELNAPLIPERYSVFKSEYDSENDLMFVFARLDSNGNGQIEDREPIHIFWIDLKDPSKTGQQY